MLLTIRDLTVTFRLDRSDITAVNGVSLDIANNETVVLAGESGSGKTITALSITRILPPNATIASGEVMFEGKRLSTLDEKSLSTIRGKSIGYIFQEPTSYLNPLFTIGNQIMEPLMIHRGKTPQEAYKETEAILSQVQLKEPRSIMASYPHQLSGGMNQRAFIAMSLACRPRLLIADEPTTALDVTIEDAILKLLARLKEQYGFSLLFITHNLSIAKKIADRIIVMYKGGIVESGAKMDIFNSPKHPHTQQLIQAYEKIGKV